MSGKTPERGPDTVLTARELAEALKVSVRQIDRLNLPTLYLGNRTRRYIWGEVLEVLQARRVA